MAPKNKKRPVPSKTLAKMLGMNEQGEVIDAPMIEETEVDAEEIEEEEEDPD